jgi:hypothetical protein
VRRLLLSFSLIALAGSSIVLGSAVGAGSGPQFSASPNPMTFDFVQVGTASPEKVLTVTNSGDAADTFGSVALAGRDAADFKLTSNGCAGATLAPGASCLVKVIFQPVKDGTRVASVKFLDSTPCANWVTIAGSGTKTANGRAAHAAACSSTNTVTTSSTSTVTTQTTTPGPTTTTTTPGSVVNTASSGGASPRTCSSRRSVQIHFKPPRGTSFRKVTVKLNTRTFKVFTGKNVRTLIPISLRGLARGRYTVGLTGVTTKGKTVTATRHFVTCVANSK